MVWRGSARLGPAVHGMTWQGLFLAGGGFRESQAVATRGGVRCGNAGLGKARALLSWWWFREWLWLGAARLGEARRGLAGFGEDTFFWRMT